MIILLGRHFQITPTRAQSVKSDEEQKQFYLQMTDRKDNNGFSHTCNSVTEMGATIKVLYQNNYSNANLLKG